MFFQLSNLNLHASFRFWTSNSNSPIHLNAEEEDAEVSAADEADAAEVKDAEEAEAARDAADVGRRDPRAIPSWKSIIKRNSLHSEVRLRPPSPPKFKSRDDERKQIGSLSISKNVLRKGSCK